MGVYDDHILPRLLHCAMRHPAAARLRARFVPAARGRVLEIGIGSALNLPFYGADVISVDGIDPSPALLEKAARAGQAAGIPVRLSEGSAEALPFEAGTFDTVVSTWSLCSIPDAVRALAEARRVLAPGGTLVFVEHGRAPELRVARWQDRLNGLWGRCAGGCNLNRPIAAMVEGAGFRTDTLETGYLIRGPRVLTHTFAGRATRA